MALTGRVCDEELKFRFEIDPRVVVVEANTLGVVVPVLVPVAPPPLAAAIFVLALWPEPTVAVAGIVASKVKVADPVAAIEVPEFDVHCSGLVVQVQPAGVVDHDGLVYPLGSVSVSVTVPPVADTVSLTVRL